MIRVLFFGPIATATGVRDVSMAYVPGLTLGNLKGTLAAQYPEAMHLATMMAVNGEHVRDMSLQLADNSEVAFMAKFSGG
ncbi:MAG: MoaD/ThiS family protein [Gallionella sp.]